MANKKLQSNQHNKKSTNNATDGTMNTTGSTVSSTTTTASASASSASLTATPTSATQNPPVSANNTTASSSSTPAVTAAPKETQNTSSSSSSTTQQQQRHSSTSSSQGKGAGGQQQQQSLKKQQHETSEKSSSAPQQNNQGYRNSGGGGGKDGRPRDKEKEKNYRSNNHANSQLNAAGNGGGSGGSSSTGNSQNSQNNRKKDKQNNRDLSSQSSHRGGYTGGGGGGGSSYNHGTPIRNGDAVKGVVGFPSVMQMTSPPPPPPTPQPPSTPQPMFLAPVQESKTVQTEPMIVECEVKKEARHRKKKSRNEHEEDEFKGTDPRFMDTVMAFKQHDAWNKVELMCELLSFLTPVDLRLVGNCIEGSIRCYTNQMRPVEKSSNCSDPTHSLPRYVCSPPGSAKQSAASSVAALQQTKQVLTTFGITGPENQMIAPPPGLALNGPAPLPFAAENGSSSSKDKHLANGKSEEKGLPEDVTPPSATSSTTGPIVPSSLLTTSSTTERAAPPVHMPPVVPLEPEMFLKAVRELTGYIYILISVCESTNRRSAAKISDYVTSVILREKAQILDRISDPLDKIDILQDIGKIVSAMIHHPAVSVDAKMSYTDLREGLRAEIEQLYRQYYAEVRESERRRKFERSARGVGDEDDEHQNEGGDSNEEEEEEEEDTDFDDDFFDAKYDQFRAGFPSGNSGRQTTHSGASSFFITRFIGRQIEKNENLFCIEIHWSDGDRTFTQRTREQLNRLQHRLLDEFGQQRSEKCHLPGMSSSMSSFDEESKKMSTSTSTMETTFPSSGGDRIVPRLPRDASASQLVQYINELSDLPARMMLSAVICEEFNGTRSRTEDESRDVSDGLIFSRWKNPRSKSPARFFRRNAAGAVEPVELPIQQPPFLYSHIPAGQLQTISASCSNCGEAHEYKNCTKNTLLDKKVEHKMRLEPEPGAPEAPTTTRAAAQAAMTSSSSTSTGIAPPSTCTPSSSTSASSSSSSHQQHHQQLPTSSAAPPSVLPPVTTSAFHNAILETRTSAPSPGVVEQHFLHHQLQQHQLLQHYQYTVAANAAGQPYRGGLDFPPPPHLLFAHPPPSTSQQQAPPPLQNSTSSSSSSSKKGGVPSNPTSSSSSSAVPNTSNNPIQNA